MSSRLTIISHAATAATRAAAFPRDEPIESLALDEARGLAESIGPFSAVWVAPERRAIETAKALDLQGDVEPLLRDIDVGRWTGQTLASIEQSDPESLLSWMSDPTAAPHGGETILQLLSRVSHWLERADGAGRRLAAVAHPAVVRAAVVQAIGAGPSAFWRIDVGPLSRVELRSNGKRWALRSLTPE